MPVSAVAVQPGRGRGTFILDKMPLLSVIFYVIVSLLNRIYANKQKLHHVVALELKVQLPHDILFPILVRKNRLSLCHDYVQMGT